MQKDECALEEVGQEVVEVACTMDRPREDTSAGTDMFATPSVSASCTDTVESPANSRPWRENSMAQMLSSAEVQ